MKKLLPEKISKKVRKVKENVRKGKEEITESEPNTTDIDVNENRLVSVKFGKPLLEIKFRTIKIITSVSLIFLLCSIVFVLHMIHSSIKIANHLGYFINMVSSGEGNKLPIFQSVPPLFFLFINIFFGISLFKMFNRTPQSRLNWFLFLTIIIDLIVIFLTCIILFVILDHIYGSHTGIHDGIVEAMKNYSSDSSFKKQIDRLQIEFQCCGSKKYDEWYSIPWYDTSLIKKPKRLKRKANTIGESSTDLVCEKCQVNADDEEDTEEGSKHVLGKGHIVEKDSMVNSSIPRHRSTTGLRSAVNVPIDSNKGNTPFSCCSVSSLFPCIHHNIEITGKAYLYTPEQNLSISTDGCHTKLTEKTVQVGWNIIATLVICIILQIGLVVGLRFLQTAHFARSKFEGHSRVYTVWLIGWGTVVSKNDRKNEPPPLPPIPADLMT